MLTLDTYNVLSELAISWVEVDCRPGVNRVSTEGTLHLEHNLTVNLGRGNVKIRKWLPNKPDGCDTDYCPKDDIATALGTRVGEITYYFHPVADIQFNSIQFISSTH